MDKPSSFLEVIERKCCQFIEGDGDDLVYCGEGKLPGKPYCQAHYDRCWRAAPSSKRTTGW